MQNGLEDLNNHMFMALERLNDINIEEDGIDDDEKKDRMNALKLEISRCKTVASVGMVICNNVRNALVAEKIVSDKKGEQAKLPAFIDPKKNERRMLS